MANWLKLGVLFMGMALIIGCGQKKVSTPGSETANLSISAKSAIPENDPRVSHTLVKKAKSAIGTPYVLGGSKPGGFDCSGLVQWAYNSMGVTLPRTAREQAAVGHKVRDVKDMRAGDIVAFRHPKRGYHTGIYVGDGKFVHSPRKKTRVRINSLDDPYFRKTLLGARRVNLDGSENLIAQVNGQLEAYVAEKSNMRISAKNLEKIRANSKKKAPVTSKIIASKKAAGKNAVANSGKKKSTIAQQASKIKSVKAVTGKTKTNTKNSEAHAKLAKASKKTSTKAVSSLSSKNRSVSVLSHRNSAKSGSMVAHKSAKTRKR